MKTNEQMKERLKWYVGRYIDFDGVYQAQCMDLTVDYMWWATERKYRMLGNAIDAINTKANQYGSYATIHKNTATFLPQVGDIAVWTKAPAHTTYGHIGIVYGDINLSTCTMLDQNWNGNPSQPAKLRTDDYRGITHFIRINFKEDSKPATNDSTSHTVKKKETLYSISKLYKMSVDEIKKLNNLKNNVIKIGQVLKTKNQVATPVPEQFNKTIQRHRVTTSNGYAKGTIDTNDVHIRNRSGSQSKGFNWNKDTGLRLKKGDVIHIYETHGGWCRIYTGNLTGNGSNRWVWNERIKITKIY